MTVKMSGDFGANTNDPNAKPDGTFLDPSERALFWLSRHWHYFAIGAALIIGGYTYWGYTKAAALQRAAAANNLLAEAEVAFDEAISAGAFASEPRLKAMQEAIAKAENVRREHADNKAARHAQFIAANAWLAMGDMPTSATTNTDKALAAFRDYASTAQTPLERAKGTLGVANALENAWFLTQDQAKLDEALKTYAELEKLATGDIAFMAVEARIAQGRLLGITGKRDQAVELLRGVMKDIYKPLPSPEDFDTPGQVMAQQLRSQLDERTLVGVARRELELLGVDTRKEFPPFAEPTVDAENADAKKPA